MYSDALKSKHGKAIEPSIEDTLRQSIKILPSITHKTIEPLAEPLPVRSLPPPKTYKKPQVR